MEAETFLLMRREAPLSPHLYLCPPEIAIRMTAIKGDGSAPKTSVTGFARYVCFIDMICAEFRRVDQTLPVASGTPADNDGHGIGR